MRSSVPVIPVALAAMLGSSSALAQSFWTKYRCITMNSTSADALVEDCTAVIKSGERNKTELSVALINRGLAYIQNGKFDLAIDDLSRSIAIEGSGIAFNSRGLAYLRKGEVDQAIGDFDAALKINPDFAEAFLRRGVAYIMKADLDRALHDMDRAIEIDPKHARAFFIRSAIKRDKGDTAGADQDMAAARSIDPNIGKNGKAGANPEN